MIQRIQSLWLLLAGVAGLLTYQLPLWEGTMMDNTKRIFNGAESLLLFAVVILTCILAFVTIFLYKNRKNQKSLTLLGMFLSLIIIVLEYVLVQNYKDALGTIASGTWKFGALMPMLMVILFFLAYRGIAADEKLVRYSDRLR